MTDPQRIEITAESIEVRLPAPAAMNVHVEQDDDKLDCNAKTQLLFTHYNDSFQYLTNHWKSRNRLFVYILILIATMAVDMSSPDTVQKLLLTWLNKTVGADDQQIVDAQIVNNVIWFVLLCLVVAYFQKSINVKRQYNYIESVEDSIHAQTGEWLVYREGRSYRSATGRLWEGDFAGPTANRRPLFLQAIGWFYSYFVPISLLGFCACKAWIELNGKYAIWKPGLPFSGAPIATALLFLTLVASTLGYLSWCRK